MAAWRTVDDIIDWSGMQGDGDEPESPRGSFITMLGIAGTTHWRVVALMPPDVFERALSTWQLEPGEGQPAYNPPPGVLAQAGMVGRFARVAGKIEKLPSMRAADDDVAIQHQRAVEFARATTPVTVAAPLIARPKAAAASGRVVTMKDIVDVCRGDEPSVIFKAAEDAFLFEFRKWRAP